MVESKNFNQIDCRIEAILFAYGTPICIEDLCAALDMDRFSIVESIERLSYYYDHEKRGIQIVRLDNSYQLCTRQEHAQVIRTALNLKESNPISKAAIEVLLIVANFQPTTQKFIDDIRGLDSSYWISWLIEHELITPVGKLDRRGNPKAYGTTLEFLRMFHLQSLSEVPEIKAIKKDDNAESQKGLNLDELAALIGS